jgi:transposase
MNIQSLVPDDLWEAIEPILPKEPPKPKGGRPRVPNRAALGGIIFVLRTGCPWRLLPKELGCGNGTTCWRRLRDWQEAGVWERLHTTVLNWLGDEAAIDWSRASVDSLSVRAKRRRGDRAEPDRPRQAWLQVPPRRRQEGHPPRRPPLGGQRPRRDPAAPPGRPDPADHRAAGTAGAAPEAPGQAARRQGVRFLAPAPCAAGSQHHPADRAAGDRLERAAGPAPLGGRAHPGVAARLPPARGAVRAASGPAPGPAAPGVRAGLRPVPRPVNG